MGKMKLSFIQSDLLYRGDFEDMLDSIGNTAQWSLNNNYEINQ